MSNNSKLTSYAEDVLAGLKYIHSSGIIHDDIKLDNILMVSAEREDEYSKAKICDFGLAQYVDLSIGKVRTDVKIGTMGYMAPEMQAVSYISKFS